MRNLGSIILLIMGIIFLAVAVFTYFVLDSAFGSIPAEASELGLGQMENIFQIAFPGIFGCIGGLMTLFGLLGLVRGSKQAKLADHIAQIGTETEANVTFVDRNYRMLVNNRPIYSIVEYTYQDGMGNEFVNRVETVSTDTVIRNNIEVGSKIKIKYLPEDPGKSVALI